MNRKSFLGGGGDQLSHILNKKIIGRGIINCPFNNAEVFPQPLSFLRP